MGFCQQQDIKIPERVHLTFLSLNDFTRSVRYALSANNSDSGSVPLVRPEALTTSHS